MPPPDLREAVELYARETGRHAELHFVPFGGWFARFTLRPDDRRNLLIQQGEVEDVSEDVFFNIPRQFFDPKVHPVIPGHEPKPDEQPRRPFIPLDILQMGVSGVRSFLERGNTWSGRGEFASQVEAFKASEERNRSDKQRAKDHWQDNARQRAKDRRRQILKIPLIPVGIDLRKRSTMSKEK